MSTLLNYIACDKFNLNRRFASTNNSIAPLTVSTELPKRGASYIIAHYNPSVRITA